MSDPLQQHTAGAATPPPYRIDAKLHQILYTPKSRPTLEPTPEPEALPEPVYPQHPDPKEMTYSEYQKRGEAPPWQCRAGQNSLIIRTDGTLAPCFPMYSATHDWGTIGNHKFDVKQLDEMKLDCSKHCLSTCNYILGYCYDTTRVVTWALKQAMHGFKGVTGSF